jgi:hypothetical protein
MGIIEVAALVSALGIGALLLELLRWGIKRNDMKSSNSFSNMFKDISLIHDILNSLSSTTPAHRIMILKTTNGGGKPTLTGTLYSSIIYESYDRPLKSIKGRWQRQMLDQSYLSILFKMEGNDGRLIIKTTALKPGILKDLYNTHGVEESHIYRIVAREKEYIYLSANFIDAGQDTAEVNEAFRGALALLKPIFKKNEKV